MRSICLLNGLVSCVVFASAGAHGAVQSNLEAHPNPAWARPWVSLDGQWRFDFDPDDSGLTSEWFKNHEYSKSINVPFCWQSRLSGLEAVDYQGAAWYERDVEIPSDLAGAKVFLVFGAVDWEATVWVNGEQAASHEGGYTPFDVELTRYAKRGETVRVTVRAFDDTAPDLPNGKQTGWYTRTGGIWQSVYMEGRGASHMTKAHVYPDIAKEQAVISCALNAEKAGAYEIRVVASQGDKEFRTAQSVDCTPGVNDVKLVLPVPEPALWTPDSPCLYQTRIELRVNEQAVDTVNTYFGMREVSRGKYADSEHEYILLNGKPIYLRGALHQSFNPEGIHTAPNDEFLEKEYAKARELGLNFIRIHIKVDEPRALYWADKMGVMLMCDVPCFWKKSDRANRLWENTMRETVARDFNHPCIISWCDFNETWGIGDGGYDRQTQEWVRDMYLLTKQLDPTRLVEDNSPCNYDHVETDINSWHFYIDDFKSARKHIDNVVEQTFPGSEFNYAEGWTQDTAPLINSEYGGVGAGSGDRDVGWVFLFLTNLLRKHGKIRGYVYTELSDIEWEHNGFLNYDRSEKLFPYPAGITVADLQGEEFPVLDCPPYVKVDAGTQVNIPVALSHWSERDGLTLRMSAHGQTVEGVPWDRFIPSVTRAVQAKPYAVTPQEDFSVRLPKVNGLLNIVVEVMDGEKRLGANYCVLDVRRARSWARPGQFAVPFTVNAYSAYTFDGDFLADRKPRDKAFGEKTGYIEYRIRLPRDLKSSTVEGCRLVAEIGAKAGDERLDWPARKNARDYPQTDGRTHPTDVMITINGVEIGWFAIADDAADARGVLSHVMGYHHGSHGQLVEAEFGEAALEALRKALAKQDAITLRFEVPEDSPNAGGLSLYGSDMGAYPIDPTLVFALKEGTPEPIDTGKIIDVFSPTPEFIITTGPEGHKWRYTTDNPGEGWQSEGYDDSAWKTGKSGFGADSTPGAKVGTQWSTSDIYLRTEITLPKGIEKQQLWLDIHHDEDAEIFVNGQMLIHKTGYARDYERIRLDNRQVALFRPGKPNTIAVHCHQTSGGQFIDMGLLTLK